MITTQIIIMIDIKEVFLKIEEYKIFKGGATYGISGINKEKIQCPGL